MSTEFAVPNNLHATKTEEFGTQGENYSIKAGLAQMLKVCLLIIIGKKNLKLNIKN
jgi:hypothetical protein